MPKGVYKRVIPIWNKGKKGVMPPPWNKNTGIRYNPAVLDMAKQLFQDYIPAKECNKILTKTFSTKVRARVFWKELFSKEERIKHRSILCSNNMLKNNPMQRMDIRMKAGLSHKGHISWNKGLKGEEYKKYYPNGMRYKARPKGYKHTLESRQKMSQNTLGKKHPNCHFSFEKRQKYAERMRKNRQDFNFNLKMFKSMQRSVSKPHKKVQDWIIKYNHYLKTIPNYPISLGIKYAEIDEADINNKIAIFVDGNYWHNYPNLNQWDKIVNTFLLNRGWKVYRFWESDIDNNPDNVIHIIKNIVQEIDQEIKEVQEVLS